MNRGGCTSRPSGPSVGTLYAVDVDEVRHRITARWNRDDAITAYDGFSDLPAAIQDEARKQGSDGSDLIVDGYEDLQAVGLECRLLGVDWTWRGGGRNFSY